RPCPQPARRQYEQLTAEAAKRGTDRNSTRFRRGVGGLVLREDGWALLKPRREQGRVLTKQFVFGGDRLRLNADCNFGQIRVELLGPMLRRDEGFSADDCDPIHNPDRNVIWHTVTWRGRSDVRSLWSRPGLAGVR